jgi:hypothetical protein
MAAIAPSGQANVPGAMRVQGETGTAPLPAPAVAIRFTPLPKSLVGQLADAWE